LEKENYGCTLIPEFGDSQGKSKELSDAQGKSNSCAFTSSIG